MSYKIISEESIKDLEEQVDEKLSKGYGLIGGVSVSMYIIPKHYENEGEVKTEYVQAIYVDDSSFSEGKEEKNNLDLNTYPFPPEPPPKRIIDEDNIGDKKG